MRAVERRRFLMPLTILVVVPLSAGLAAGQAFGPLPDHLKCYKIKDSLKLAGVVDLLSPQLGLESGCRLGSAKLFCVPAFKRVVQVTGATPQQVLGDAQVDDRLCYKIKCPSTVIPQKGVIDQFGNHTITKFKASLLCTPARKTPIENDVFPNTTASVLIEAAPSAVPAARR